MTRSDDPMAASPDAHIEALQAVLEIGPEPEPTEGEALLVWQFLPMEAGLPGWREERVRRLSIEGWPPTTRSSWRPAQAGAAKDDDEEVLLVLDTHECADAADARRWLFRVLAGVQATAIERLSRDAPGDVAVGMPQGGLVVFTRANLVCALRNGGRTVRSMAAAAGSLDGWVTERPEAGGRLAPEILRAEAAPAQAGGQLALRVEAREPADRPVWFKLTAPSGTLALVDGEPQYRPAPGAGATTLTVYAVGPGGAAVETMEIPAGPAEPRGRSGQG
jgi:hypothetical protein